MISFAVIGAGHISKRHIAMLQAHPETQVVAACDVLPQAEVGLSDFQGAFFGSAEEMLAADLPIEVV